MLDKNLLRKYLDGDCTEEEKLIVQKYLAESGTDLTELDMLLRSSWEESREMIVPQEETMRHLRKLRGRLYQEENNIVSIRRPNLRYMAYAAAIIAAVILIPLIWLRSPQPDQVQIASDWDSVGNPGNTAVRFMLPDSSTVWISPNSTIYWNMHSTGQRMVKLEGEAFFDVTHMTGKPFIVQTGPIDTRVLGTAFNIEAYQQEAAVRISLVRGKVAVEKKLPKTDTARSIETLRAGEVLSYDKADSSSHKAPLIITDIRQWTAGNLVLNDVLMLDALQCISLRYNIAITCTNKARYSNKRISTVFKRETTEKMLEIISFITGCRYKKNGKDEIEIY